MSDFTPEELKGVGACLSALDYQEGEITIVLDFVNPVGALRRVVRPNPRGERNSFFCFYEYISIHAFCFFGPSNRS
jgi:hypothetical protein